MKKVVFLLLTFILPNFGMEQSKEEQLFNAIERNDLTAVKKLLTDEIKINATDKNGNTPLIIAVKNKNIPLAEELLKKNPNIDIQNKDGETALSLAIKQQMVAMVKLLLEQSFTFHGAMEYTLDKNGDTPLILAIKQKNISIIEEVLKEVPKTNVKNKVGETAMDIVLAMPEESAEEKILKDKLIKLLVQAEAQYKFETAVKTPYTTQENPNIDTIEKFIKQGASINIPRGEDNPLYTAVRWDELNLVELLIKYNVDINQQTKEGKIPLVTAAKYSRPAIVKALLQKGAKLDNAESDGSTALVNAIYRFFKEKEGNLGFDIVQQLLAAGADPLTKNLQGVTVFDMVIANQAHLAQNKPNLSGLSASEKKKREENYQQKKQLYENIVKLLESKIPPAILQQKREQERQKQLAEEQARQQKERERLAEAERQRQAAEEQARQEQERQRIAREAEEARLAQERVRLAQEEERKKQERLRQEQLTQERLERERLEQQKREQEREQERLKTEQQRLQRERLAELKRLAELERQRQARETPPISADDKPLISALHNLTQTLRALQQNIIIGQL